MAKEVKCPTCGSPVLDENTWGCSYCGKQVCSHCVTETPDKNICAACGPVVTDGKPMVSISGMLHEAEILANWWLNPSQFLRWLKHEGFRDVPGRLNKQADWQVLHRFEHGELGYDREEGIGFRWNPLHLAELIAWVRKIHQSWNMPLTTKQGPVFHVNLNISEHLVPAFVLAARELGLEHDDNYGHWYPTK